MTTNVRKLEAKWREIGQRETTADFNGKTHLLFANELAVAIAHDALNAPDTSPDRFKLIVPESMARMMEEAGLQTTQIKISGPMEASDFAGYPNSHDFTLSATKPHLASVTSTVRGTLPVSEEGLIAEYEAYTKEQGLPHLCAEELIHGFLLPAQRAWLTDFIIRWEAYFRSVDDAHNARQEQAA